MINQIKNVIYDSKELIPIPIESVKKGINLPFIIYFRLNANKFILLSNANSPLDCHKIERYKEKGLKELYIQKYDRKIFFRNYLDNVNEILRDDSVPLSRKAEVLNGYANTLIGEIYSRKEPIIDVELAKASVEVVENIINLASSDMYIVENFVQLNKINKYQYSQAIAGTSFCISFAKFLGYNKPHTLKNLGLAALLHDVGNRFIEPKILNSDKPLTDEEVLEMKKVPKHSAKIAQKIKDYSLEVCKIILQHHEKWNGTGYPNRLRGKDIHVSARILSIVDSFVSMVCTKTYGKKHSIERALEILFAEKGKYEPRLVTQFFEMFKKQLKFKKENDKELKLTF